MQYTRLSDVQLELISESLDLVISCDIMDETITRDSFLKLINVGHTEMETNIRIGDLLIRTIMGQFKVFYDNNEMNHKSEPLKCKLKGALGDNENLRYAEIIIDKPIRIISVESPISKGDIVQWYECIIRLPWKSDIYVSFPQTI